MASKFGVEAGEILSADADNMAVRVALGETNIVQETKKFLQKEGVDLDVLRRQKDKKAKRSKTVFLVKNLPHTTNKEELRALFANYGELGRIVLPESRAMALVEYLQANEAKAAFNHLSYSRFHHVPLYLEWAPMMVFIRPPTEEEIANSRLAEEEVEAERKSSGHAATKDTPFSMEDASEDLEAMDVPSLFVKNLNFDTTEESLKEFVEKRLAGRKVTIRSVRIAQKNTKGKVLSMGFGFVELGSKEQAVAAMKALQGKELDGHKIELKFSKANAKPGASLCPNVHRNSLFPLRPRYQKLTCVCRCVGVGVGQEQEEDICCRVGEGGEQQAAGEEPRLPSHPQGAPRALQPLRTGGECSYPTQVRRDVEGLRICGVPHQAGGEERTGGTHTHPSLRQTPGAGLRPGFEQEPGRAAQEGRQGPSFLALMNLSSVSLYLFALACNMYTSGLALPQRGGRGKLGDLPKLEAVHAVDGLHAAGACRCRSCRWCRPSAAKGGARRGHSRRSGRSPKCARW